MRETDEFDTTAFERQAAVVADVLRALATNVG